MFLAKGGRLQKIMRAKKERKSLNARVNETLEEAANYRINEPKNCN